MKHLMTVALTATMPILFCNNSQAAGLRDQLQANLQSLVASALDSTSALNASTINRILYPNNPGPGSTSVIISKSPSSTARSGNSSVLNASTILKTLNFGSMPSTAATAANNVKVQLAAAQQKAQVAAAQQKAQSSFAQQRLTSANSLNARYNQVMAAAKAKTGSTSVPSNISASHALALGKLMAKRLVRSLK